MASPQEVVAAINSIAGELIPGGPAQLGRVLGQELENAVPEVIPALIRSRLDADLAYLKQPARPGSVAWFAAQLNASGNNAHGWVGQASTGGMRSQAAHDHEAVYRQQEAQLAAMPAREDQPRPGSVQWHARRLEEHRAKSSFGMPKR